MSFPNKEELELLYQISSELDGNIYNAIQEMLSKHHYNNDPIYIAAVVNSLSYNLGLAIAELAILTNTQDITPLILASAKIVTSSIRDLSELDTNRVLN